MENSRTQSRRELLKHASVGAATVGAAWVVPQIHSSASAQSPGCSNLCTPSEVNLLGAGFGNGNDVVATSPKAVFGTAITFTRTNTDSVSGSGLTLTTGVVSNATLGAFTSGFIPMCVKANNATQDVAITMTFSVPVRQLEFTLLDIDASNTAANPYREQVVISWAPGIGTPVPAYTPGWDGTSTVPTNLTGPPPADTYQVFNSTFNAANTDASCNLLVDFGACGTISSVTVTSNDLNTAIGTSTTGGRAVGIAGLKFCPA